MTTGTSDEGAGAPGNLEQMEVGMEYTLRDAAGKEAGRVLVVSDVPGGSASVELWAYDARFEQGGTYTFTRAPRSLTGSYAEQRDAFRKEQRAAHPAWRWVEARCTKPEVL